MKPSLIILLLLLVTSCFPVRNAPKIEGDKLMVAKKFKKGLPKTHALVFEDPKDANEFYNFINTKYELNHINVEDNVPFVLDNETFYFSFYEIERISKTINLVPVLVDATLENKGKDPVLTEYHTSREGTWYLVLTASDYDSNDALSPKHPSHKKIENYLRNLRIEYLNTSNYIEALLLRKG